MLSAKSLLEITSAILGAPEKMNLYFVIDRAAIKKWPDDLWPLHSGAYRSASLFGTSGGAEHDEAAPFLIQFSETDSLYKYLVKEAEKSSLGLFLVSFKGWEQTYNEAQSWLWPKKINGDQIYFRYYDPRVLTAMSYYYQEIDQPLPMSSFDEIFWCDPIQEATFHLKTTELMVPFSMKNPWQLEPDLEEFLVEAYIPFRIMDMLKDADARFCEISDPKLYKKVDFLLKDAAAYRIMEIKDLFHFCHLSFLFPGFTAHLGTAEKLAAFGQSGNRDFYGLVNSIPTAWLTPYKSKEII